MANTVIGVSGDDEACTTSMNARDAQREIVSFAAGAGQHQAIGCCGEVGEQSLRITNNAFIKIARMHVEPCRLFGNGIHYARMAMTNAWHIVIRIQIGIAFTIVKPYTACPIEMHGFLIEHAIWLPQNALAALDETAGALIQVSGFLRVERVDHHGYAHGMCFRFRRGF